MFVNYFFVRVEFMSVSSLVRLFYFGNIQLFLPTRFGVLLPL